MAESWSESVNKKFYNVSTANAENVIRTEYESGRTKTSRKNTTPRKEHSFNCLLWTNSEEVAFWSWYDSTVKSGSLSFNLPNLITGTGTTEYQFTSEPSVAAGSYPRELSMNVREV